MKRLEKNQQMKSRIMAGALQEFSRHGYEGCSMNAISSAVEVSKGIIYHYFANKDELFLACVEECFSLLTDHLRNKLQDMPAEPEAKLSGYFSARLNFFADHPQYQGIFCEAIMLPPAHLRELIQEKKQAFEALNLQILEELLQALPLRASISRSEAIRTFRDFQDFINARYQVAALTEAEFQAHERQCQRALNILLYGVVERK